MDKRTINPFGENIDLKIGDFILFQEYKSEYKDGHYQYNISKPIYAIYLGFYILDMALAFNYVKWINNNREMVTNEKGYSSIKEITEIQYHIEWDDFVDIIGHWNHRPTKQELLTAYRKYNTKSIILSDEINIP